MHKIIATGVILVGAGAAVIGCSSSASGGTVTGYAYTPPSVQSVDTSCSYWSGSKSLGYCLDYQTAQEPAPQECKLTYKDSSGATGTTDLNVDEAACKSYIGRTWPLDGGSQ